MEEKNKCRDCGSEASCTTGECCANERKTDNTCKSCGHKCNDKGASECACKSC